MGFAAENIIEHPPWDSNTDEVVVALLGGASGLTTIPDYCYFVIVSSDANHLDGIFISPDAVDVDSGLQFMNGAGDTRVPLHVTPGVVLNFHNADAVNAINVNVVRFYNQPSN